MTILLRPAELLLQAVNRVRRALYRGGILKARQLPRRVISVGNIAIGGTGKTPAVIAICRFLEQRGMKVCVLSRGYGGTVTGAVDSLDPTRFGDEPVLIKKSTRSTRVIVGKNRYNNAIQEQCDIFVLDDAFQHLQLHRDLDIVIDAPARFHREGRDAWRDADLVIPRRLRLNIPGSLRGKRLFAFSGLADNEQFFESLRAAGLRVERARGFPDHHRYSELDLKQIRHAARGTDAIVTTEKDAVKIDASDIVPIAAEFIFDAEVLQRIESVARA